MTVVYLLFGVCFLTYGIHIVQDAIVCDISHRETSCPNGHCCVRDEFILEDVLCKPYGVVNSRCTTVASESECPCLEGLYCKPMIISQDFTSIYGNCQIISEEGSIITNAPDTTSTETTTSHTINHPPMIHFRDTKILLSKEAVIGESIASFSVSDNDLGKDGEVTCEILQATYFRIAKMAPHRFELVVATSLRTLSLQTLTVFIDCKDNGQHPANNIIELHIKILNEIPTTATTETNSTELTTDSMTTETSTGSLFQTTHVEATNTLHTKEATTNNLKNFNTYTTTTVEAKNGHTNTSTTVEANKVPNN